jgi:hypothetical protein
MSTRGARGGAPIGRVAAAGGALLALFLGPSFGGCPPALALPTGFEAEPFRATSADARLAPDAPATPGDEALSFLFFRRRKPAPEPVPAVGDSAAAPAPAAEAPRAKRERVQPRLGAARARVLLRSLTLPGWGQATEGHPRAAKVFALLEVGVWASFTSFRVQEALRRESYENTARIFAGIDMRGRDEEFRRIVGAFDSSDEYNRLVVSRDAANLYLSDPDHPDYAGYHAYIDAHSLKGTDTWTWSDEDTRLRYRGQRKASQRAAQRANAALAVAILDRLMSVVHASRMSPAGEPARSLHLEIGPAPGTDPTAFRLGVRARF